MTFGDTNPGSAPQAFRFRIRLADRDSSACLTATGIPAPVPTPTPTPTPTGALSGTWTGTVTATISTGNPRPPQNASVVFQHSGNLLTGTFSGYPATLDLQAGPVSGAVSNFTGNLNIADSGRTAAMAGSMRVNASDNTMTGTFSGTNTDGLAERNVFSLRKQ